MDVWCEICYHKWDALDPGVRFVYGDGRWECMDEVQCFGRRAIEMADAAGAGHGAAARGAAVTPEEIADVFMEWFTEAGLTGKVDTDEVSLLAEAFGAGCRYGNGSRNDAG